MEKCIKMTNNYTFQLAKNQANNILQLTLKEIKIEEALNYSVDSSKGSEYGLLSSPICFSLSKIMKKDPQTLSKELEKIANEKLQEIGLEKRLFERVEGLAGFLNFFACSKFYSSSISQAVEGKVNYGKSDSLNGINFVVEFSSPNLGKPLHVGHIRGTILGDSICNLLSTQKANVTKMNYPADAGTQIAQLIVAMRKFKDLPQATDEMGLYEYYKKINEEIEKNPQLKEEVKEVGLLIENASPRIMMDLENINKVSFSALAKNYQMLSINFDVVATESQFINPAKKIVEECLQKGFAKKELDGSVVALLEEHGLSNTLLLKSNGTTLYITRDLALADYKFSTLHFKRSLVLTAMEQNLHFKQVQKLLELLNRPYYEGYNHLGFGLVFLKNSKMSTRQGNVVFLKEVLDQTIEQSRLEIEKRKPEYDKQLIQEISGILGVGALKFAFLKVSSERNMNFDPVASAQFEGDTGPYIQYSAVRATNIINKINEQANFKNLELSGISEEFIWSEQEKELASLISLYPSVVQSAATSQAPHIICDYLLRLSASFSKFYEAKKVIGLTDPIQTHSRTMIVMASYNVLVNGLNILGIKIPEKM